MDRRYIALLLTLAGVLPAAELPVREVILYKHGVGYFQRGGELKPGESARLDFKTAEMNDVLKSLTVQDAAGNRVTAVRYESNEPLDEKLGRLPFGGSGERPPSLIALLDRLRGGRVALRTAAGPLEGAIVSARLVPGGQDRAERQELVLLLDNGEIRTIDLSAVASLSFADPVLQDQLRDYLRVLSEARSQEKRSVYIDSAGGAPRRLTATYMIPAPVWKSSYRLIFADAAATLEGWAIVDNTTGDDWKDVRLALVSGRPISFITELYEPRYRDRPVGELPDDPAGRPVIHAGGVMGGIVGGVPGGVAPEEAGSVRRDQARFKAAAPPPPAAMAMADIAEARQEAAPSTVAAPAAAREIGELFEYRFATPLTVRKGESAMIPFLQQKIDSRKLLIFSETGSEHPTNAVELTNATGKTLDGGPVTVYDSGVYAGEALMTTVKAGDKRLVSYAVDLGTRITPRFDTGSETVREIHARRGMLTLRNAVQETRTYTIRNVDSKPKTLIVEHPVRQQYKLLNQKPAETTASAYRFEVKLPANGTEKFAVSEERVYDRALLISSLTPDVLFTYVQNKGLSEIARKQLEEALALKRKIAETQSQLGTTRTQIEALNRDAGRVRENINSLNRVSGQQEQVQQYARRLSELETRIAGLRDREGDLEAQRVKLETELNTLLEKMEF